MSEEVFKWVEYRGVKIECPEEVRYIATDEAGLVLGFTDEPIIEDGEWKGEPEDGYVLLISSKLSEGWRYSLKEC